MIHRELGTHVNRAHEDRAALAGADLDRETLVPVRRRIGRETPPRRQIRSADEEAGAGVGLALAEVLPFPS